MASDICLDSSAGEARGAGGPHLQLELPRKTVNEVLENLGTGLAQVRVAALSAPIFFADGVELLLISSVTRAVSLQWGFSGFQRSAVVSLVYAGMGIGNFSGGLLGDQLGRRFPILLSFLLVFIFSSVSSMAWGFKSLSFLRFVVGVSIGMGQPVQRTLMNEVTPSKWRAVFSSIGEFAFGTGELFAGMLVLLDDPEMRSLHWRALLLASATPPAVFGLLAFAFLRQSPLFLAYRGHYEEARSVLESMRSENRAHEVSVDFKLLGTLRGRGGDRHSIARQLGVVFGSEMLVTSMIAMFSLFNMNLGYFGAMYAFPQVMVDGVKFGRTPAENLIFGVLVEILGTLAAVPCILWCNRKLTMRLYLVVTALSFFAFAVGCSSSEENVAKQLFLYLGYYGENFSRMSGFLVLYTYATEVYPTMARSTGTAVCFASGKAAALIAPFLYELVLELSGGRYEIFFHAIAAINLANLVMVHFLPFETFGKPLREENGAGRNE